ncbi:MULTISPECIES: hypothetical protein [unclassified Sphingomonas]|uniref:hypothetical protein n=1 Tax=unclassified Sphingomonas TaxID=196159 RepID=UPI000ACCFD17|nr:MULTISPECIES: hypothetical protein [unclassified Sphingomonas]
MIDRPWLREQLIPDGSVRHIIVEQPDGDDWQRLWSALRRHDPKPSYFCGADPTRMPPTIESVFALSPEPSRTVLFEWRGVTVTFCIYGGLEADFTVNPADTDHDTAIVDLLGWLGDLLHRPVTLIHENRPDYTILHYDPADGRYAHPPWP